ncbi:sugar phosphate isomerase/epimerase family protein [Candidatus Poriferisocius sp.]|uniref:sugar phosphate isomerase/epimerase family protein n=1 Tax=Candidatus Poriferisocius sp. TaxID=3101276 RepID=UPI003B01EC36
MNLLERLATAPISWGVCEMPGWGHQLPCEAVLKEMSSTGFTHTELGSLGYLPKDPAELRSALNDHNLSLLGGFVPLVLHDPAQVETTRAAATEAAALISGGGGRYFVTCAVSHPDNWRQRPLAQHECPAAAAALDEVEKIAADHGLIQALHPHFGSLVETAAETEHMLESSDTALVLDTAHLLLGGGDVADMAKRYLDRIALVHIKDVNLGIAARVTAGELSLMQGVQQGLFPPLGQGGLPIAEIVDLLEKSGRNLWYVLEQDAAIAEGDPSAIARLRFDACQSIDFLRRLEPATAGAGTSQKQQHLP